MLPAGSDARKQCQSIAIYSPDGERLPFEETVVTEGQPEVWLNDVERAMFRATKEKLFRVFQDNAGMNVLASIAYQLCPNMPQVEGHVQRWASPVRPVTTHNCPPC